MKVLRFFVLLAGTALSVAPAASAQSGSFDACFTQTPASPTTGQEVTFDATCSAGESARAWDLDNDGSYDDGTAITAKRTFTTAGTYTIKLGIYNGSSSNPRYDTATKTVTVTNRNPTASFTFAPAAPTTGQAVTFTSTSTDPDGTIASQAWDLDNDGAYDDGTAATASRTFTTSGSYPIKLRTVDNNGGVGTSSQNVTVSNRAPAANFTFAPASPTTGQAVTFTSSSTDPDGTVASQAWDLDNDGQYDDGTAATASRSFPTSGNYTVKLRVVDDKGTPNEVSKTVGVGNRAPLADFSISNASPATGASVTFTSTSTDPDGTIASQAWDLDNDGAYDDGTAATATRSFPTAGTYTIKLRVVDNGGTASAVTKTLTAGNRGPNANFSWSPTAPLTGQTVTFSGVATDPDGTIKSIKWDLDGDFKYDEGTTGTVTKVFTKPGTYSVHLRAEDNAGAVAVATKTVTVGNRAPTIGFTVDPLAPTAGETVTLTSTAVDSDGSISNLEWDLDGDGAFDDATGPTATTTFPAAGSYVIGLRATDDRSVAESGTQTIDVADALPAPTTPAAGGGNFDTSIPTTPTPPAVNPPVVQPPGALVRLDPFPIVRIRGRALPTGARISLLTVKAPTGAKVELRCYGKRCPIKRTAAKVKSKRATGMVRFKKIERLLPAGTVIRVLITKKGAIGKYTQFKIRRGRAPQREDKCLMPGSSRGTSCEAG